MPPAWFDRYTRRFADYPLPDSKADRYALAAQIGTDGRLLLDWLYAAAAEESVQWRIAEDLPPALLLMRSPSDAQARSSKKRETEWVVYKVHLTETGDEDRPHLVTTGETTLATTALLKSLWSEQQAVRHCLL